MESDVSVNVVAPLVFYIKRQNVIRWEFKNKKYKKIFKVSWLQKLKRKKKLIYKI